MQVSAAPRHAQTKKETRVDLRVPGPFQKKNSDGSVVATTGGTVRLVPHVDTNDTNGSVMTAVSGTVQPSFAVPQVPQRDNLPTIFFPFSFNFFSAFVFSLK